MLNLPNIYALPGDCTPCSVYFESKPLDVVRIHVVISEDGTPSPMLFIGSSIYKIER